VQPLLDRLQPSVTSTSPGDWRWVDDELVFSQVYAWWFIEDSLRGDRSVHASDSYWHSLQLHYLLRAFYRSLDAVFGHIGWSASEEVVINLVTHICLPILLYGTAVCQVSKSDTDSFDFAINRYLMKLFKTNNINIIDKCRVHFGVILRSSLITSRTVNFMSKLQFLENSFCSLFN